MSVGGRVLLIVLTALVAHLLVLSARRLSRRAPAPQAKMGRLARWRPKLASLSTLFVSAATFAIYFGALGLILGQFGISLTAYFASATVIGLAIGFGSQGLVQDVVTGLTMIFSDVLDVADVVDIGGQTGRVESIGLRFTVLRTLVDQQVFVPNRSIAQINRYRNGHVRAYLDVQIPDGVDPESVRGDVEHLARGLHAQHAAIVLAEPELSGVEENGPGGWRYLRVKFRLWPGQGALIEGVFGQRVLAALRRRSPDYADWMLVVTYRAAG